LVIGGASDPGVDVYRRELDRLATVRGVSDRIIWAGHLSASEIAWCFREAAAFVTTSRAEACPNIVLEAMRQGAVSVATQHAPMPEFYRDTALYYRPGDAGDLAHAIDAVLNMKSADRQERRERAHARSLDFEWSITARRTLNELLSPATQRA
jgi:glycosyltransferase involved in cell wall biosynthesis